MFKLLLFQKYRSKRSIISTPDGKQFQELCLKIWQKNSEPLGEECILRSGVFNFATPCIPYDLSLFAPTK